MRRRRMVLMIGVVVLALMVAALAGLRRAGSGGAARPRHGGLNPLLPAAHFRAEKPMDKLGIAEKADRDSARGLEREKAFGRLAFGSVAGAAADSSAGRLLGQLDKLKQLVRPPRMEDASGPVGPAPGAVGPAAAGIGLFRPSAPESSSRERLEELLRGMHRPDTGRTDPQLDRLSGMLDKIMRIQRGPLRMADSN